MAHDEGGVAGVQLPRASELDGGPLFLPRQEQRGCGALTFLPAPNRSILAWWGSPFDHRGKVNNAIVAPGRLTATELWDLFGAAYPRLAPLLTMPQIVAGWP